MTAKDPERTDQELIAPNSKKKLQNQVNMTAKQFMQ